jgi:hypothetical protein
VYDVGSLFAGANARRASPSAGRGGFWSGALLLALTGVAAFVGLQLLASGGSPSALAWLAYLSGLAAILYQPRYGVYLILFFTLLADASLMPWYPFQKNFSSAESLLFFNSAMIFSPLESYLVVTLLSWLLGGAMRREFTLLTGPLFWPAMAFGLFMGVGLAYGIATGGSVNIALWEARALFYLPLMLVLTSNLITTRAHVNTLFWLTVVALSVVGIVGLWKHVFVLQGEISRVHSIVDHSTAIRLGLVVVMAIAVGLFNGSVVKRIVLPLVVPAVLVTFVVAQRRASFMALALALVFIFVILYFRKRQLFWWLAPPAVVAAVGYLGAFWNNTGALGLPARAIKSLVFSDAGTAQEQSSDIYRVIENINISFTIHNTSPFTGVGFGKKFLIIAQLPDISFFTWWEYITHNSVMWIWMKAGLTGFLSVIFLFGLSLALSARVCLRMPPGDMTVVAVAAMSLFAMHFLYAYVDMSWDIQSMIHIGTTMGLVNSLEAIVARPVPLPPKRWPWLPDPQPPPALVPLHPQGVGQ